MRGTVQMIRDPMLTHLFSVERIRKETYDTFTVELKPRHSSSVTPFAPGQFNMLYVLGIGEVPISISGDPAEPETLVHTTRAVGTVTKAMRKLRRGDTVGVRGPFGTQWPIKESERHDVVIVAGGIGLAPLRPAVYQILSQRNARDKFVLLYGARTPEDLLYWKEIERWRHRSDFEVDVTVDRASGAWRGNVGVVTTLIPKATFNPPSTIAMVCGPEIMMRFTVADLQKRGVPTENIYISMERNMKCGFGFCGHCQFGPFFVCRDGPVFRYDRVKALIGKEEI